MIRNLSVTDGKLTMNFVARFVGYSSALAFVFLVVPVSLAGAAEEWIAPKVIGVSSESPSGFDRRGEYAVNGSGLADDGTHVVGENGVTWCTVGSYGNDYSPSITFDLGTVAKVTGLKVWNYNTDFRVALPESVKDGAELSTLQKFADGVPLTVLGADRVDVMVSRDGNSFRSGAELSFAMAPGTGGYQGDAHDVDFEGVRYVRFEIRSNHDGAIFDGTGEKRGAMDGRALTGLSEVRFLVERKKLFEVKAPEGGLAPAEGGSAAGYQVRLAMKPAAPVTVFAIPSGPQLALSGKTPGLAARLEFTPETWDAWQHVDAVAVDDSVHTPRFPVSIRHAAVSKGDPEFDGAGGNELKVMIQENDPEHAKNETAPMVPAPEDRMKWWRDSRYFWFIHWNPSSLAGTEISWSRGAVPKEKYDQLYKEFNPVDFDADEWVRIAKAAGFKSLVFTTKHHDGFCMWDTKTTEYNIMNTPFGRDVLKELAEACKRQNFRFSIYYSILDWYHPHWPTYYGGGPGTPLKEGEKPDFSKYIEYMNAQVTELLTNYGPVHMIWWDGTDGRPQFTPPGVFWTDETARALEDLTRSLQPSVVMNNRVGFWNGNDISQHWWIDEYGDYDSSEMGMSHFNDGSPWEYTFTLGTQWAWRKDDAYKSATSIVQSMLQVGGRDGNLLLNTSPGPSGRFEDRVVDRLAEIGDWLDHYGDSYYGTRGGPFLPGGWGVSTHKGNRIFVHVLSPAAFPLKLPVIEAKVVGSSLMTGGEVSVKQGRDGIKIDVPDIYRRDASTIVVLELDAPASGIKPR